MALPSLSYIARRTAQVVLYVVLAAFILFFALTRTQVGRNGLAHQAEKQFNSQFQGRLEIGTLQGNLVKDLFASDVRLYDPEGRLVARVDSLVLKPHWSAFFKRELSISEIKLFRPSLHLLRTSAGQWTIEEALTRVGDRDTARAASSPWHLASAGVYIESGRIETNSTVPLPKAVAQDHIFNYTNATLYDLQGRAHLDWKAAPPQLDIFALSGTLADPFFQLRNVEGQILFGENDLRFTHLRVATAHSRLTLAGSLSRLERRAQAPALSLELRPSQVDFDEWRRLFPILPLADAAQVEGSLQGSLSDLHVERFTLQRQQTRLRGQGTLSGLPDSLDFFLTLDTEGANLSRLEPVVPSANLSRLSHLGRVSGSITARGLLHLPRSDRRLRLEATSTLDLRSSSAGHVAGSVNLSKPDDQPLRYDARLHADTLNLAHLLKRPRLTSRVSGELTLSGQGLSTGDAQAEVRVQLQDSWMNALPLDALDMTLQADSGRVYGTAQLGYGAEAITAVMNANLAASTPAYELTLTSHQADLGPFLNLDSLSTEIAGQLSIRASGTSWATAQGQATLRLDSSHVAYRQHSYNVPPHQTSLTLAPASAEAPRLHVGGDLIELAVQGDVTPRLIALSEHWGHAFQSRIIQAASKSYRSEAPFLLEIPSISDEDAFLREQEQPLRATAALRIKRPELFHALLPMFPLPPNGLTAKLQVWARADSLQLEGTARADAFKRGALQLENPQIEMALSGGPPDSLASSLQTRFALRSDSAYLLRQPIRNLSLTLDHARRTSRIQLTSGPPDRPGPLHLDADLALLEERNRLTVHALRVAAGSYVWTNDQAGQIDFYADALVVPGLSLVNEPTGPVTHPQRFTVKGIFSRAPQDTLHLRAESVALREVSRLMGLKQPVGGLLNGQLAFTGAARSPELTGRLAVNTLSFDNRILGNLWLSSRYLAGTPDIALEAALRPVSSPASAPPVASTGPFSLASLPSLSPSDTLYLRGLERPLEFEPNHLDVAGTFQLPRRTGPAEQPGALDLQLNVGRLDTFFLEYIFDKLIASAEGYLHGSSSIMGTFNRPVFQSAMQLEGGAVDIPRFNLHYEGHGSVLTDAAGVHLDGLTLTDATGGSAVLGGSLLFNDYRFFSFDLDATLEEMRVMNTTVPHDLPFYGEILGSGEFTLTGPLPSATIRSTNATISPESEIRIPIDRDKAASEAGFIVFADSTGHLPDMQQLTHRTNILADRPAGERRFVEGLDLDLNIYARPGTTVQLILDPLLGDVINAAGSGRIQLQRREGELSTYGTLNVSGGDYLFTAGELFFRRFLIKEGGAITWDGPTNNPALNMTATYRTRASHAGLPEGLATALPATIPVTIQVDITRRLSSPQIDLNLAVDRKDQKMVSHYEGLETFLNQPERTAEYATSVLLTNSFLLTTSLASQRESGDLASTRNRFAFSSISQLVGSQLNRYLSAAIPNLDVSFGLQGQNTQDLGVTYGVALRLLDERLVIRGEGAYQNEQSARRPQGLEGEFVVEVRLNPNVSVEVFYRREDDLLATDLTNTTGAGLSYQKQFPTWRRLLDQLFGWTLLGDNDPEDAERDS